MKLPYHWKLYLLAALMLVVIPGTVFLVHGSRFGLVVFVACLVLYIVVDILVLARKQSRSTSHAEEEDVQVPFHGTPEEWTVLESAMQPAIREQLRALDRELSDGVIDSKGYKRQIRRLIRKYSR